MCRRIFFVARRSQRWGRRACSCRTRILVGQRGAQEHVATDLICEENAYRLSLSEGNWGWISLVGILTAPLASISPVENSVFVLTLRRGRSIRNLAKMRGFCISGVPWMSKSFLEISGATKTRSSDCGEGRLHADADKQGNDGRGDEGDGRRRSLPSFGSPNSLAAERLGIPFSHRQGLSQV